MAVNSDVTHNAILVQNVFLNLNGITIQVHYKAYCKTKANL